MRGGENVSGEVRDPVTELVVTLREKAVLLVVKGLADVESGVAAVRVMRKLWGI